MAKQVRYLRQGICASDGAKRRHRGLHWFHREKEIIED